MSDREDIVQLVARSADVVNRLDVAGYKNLWAPEATWIIDAPLNFKFQGSRDDLAVGFEAGMKMVWKSYIQLAHGTVVDVNGDKAHARTYITEQGIRLDGGNQFLYGVYEDDLVRTNEGWRFSKRHFHYLHLNQQAISGQSAGIGSVL